MSMFKNFIFDVDGVFTDGKCYFDSDNNVIKYYNIKDGMGLKILKDNNILDKFKLLDVCDKKDDLCDAFLHGYRKL